MVSGIWLAGWLTGSSSKYTIHKYPSFQFRQRILFRSLGTFPSFCRFYPMPLALYCVQVHSSSACLKFRCHSMVATDLLGKYKQTNRIRCFQSVDWLQAKLIKENASTFTVGEWLLITLYYATMRSHSFSTLRSFTSANYRRFWSPNAFASIALAIHLLRSVFNYDIYSSTTGCKWFNWFQLVQLLLFHLILFSSI